jgi:phosphoglycolate phosphatase
MAVNGGEASRGAWLRQGAVVFDLDGVLVDSRAPITSCINAALEAHGLALEPVDSLERWIGPPLREAFRALLAARGADPNLADSCLARYRERYARASLEQTRVVPGMEAVLARLSRDVPLAVATSKPEAFARPILESLGLSRWFKAVAGPPLEATHLESKAATVARALAGLGSSSQGGEEDGASGAVMVGDRRFDVEAGRSLGLVTVGVTWGIGDAVELRAAGADVLVDSPSELLRLLVGAGDDGEGGLPIRSRPRSGAAPAG